MFNQIPTNTMTMMMMTIPMNDFSKKDFLIVALDFDNSQKALDLVQQIPAVNFYKVGMELFYSRGPLILQSIKEFGKKIFLDLKINDIPKTIEKSVRKLASYDVDYITVFCKSDGIKAALEGVGGTSTKILNVTVLTSEEAAPADVLDRALLSHEAGAHGIICSGHETGEVRNVIQDARFIIVNPGIRMIAGNDDQVRIVTPAEAMRAGATNIVVGRPVTQATDPKAAVDQIFASLGD